MPNFGFDFSVTSFYSKGKRYYIDLIDYLHISSDSTEEAANYSRAIRLEEITPEEIWRAIRLIDIKSVLDS